jgi:hypothetical protein
MLCLQTGQVEPMDIFFGLDMISALRVSTRTVSRKNSSSIA